MRQNLTLVLQPLSYTHQLGYIQPLCNCHIGSSVTPEWVALQMLGDKSGQGSRKPEILKVSPLFARLAVEVVDFSHRVIWHHDARQDRCPTAWSPRAKT